MVSGTKMVKKAPVYVFRKIKKSLARENFGVVGKDEKVLRFHYGAYRTSASPVLPIVGTVRISMDGALTRIDYEIDVVGAARFWLSVLAVLFCWAVVPPILIHRAMTSQPKRFMEGILGSI